MESLIGTRRTELAVRRGRARRSPSTSTRSTLTAYDDEVADGLAPRRSRGCLNSALERRALSSTSVPEQALSGARSHSHVARVVSVDVSDPMVCKDARARHRGSCALDYSSYQHEGDPPDAVFTRNALHHLPGRSGRRSHSSASHACYGPAACCVSGTSFTRSSHTRRMLRSLRGSRRPPRITLRGGLQRQLAEHVSE